MAQEPRLGEFKIGITSDPDSFPPNHFIQTARASGQGVFLVNLLDPEKKLKQSLSEGARSAVGTRPVLVDPERGLTLTFRDPLVIGEARVEGGIATAVFVAEDDEPGDGPGPGGGY